MINHVRANLLFALSCRFANADGGTLFVGINDKGHVGVSQADKLLEDIPNKVRDILGILVDVNLQSTPHY
jgi:ATP-dependent DNA helicase RecG